MDVDIDDGRGRLDFMDVEVDAQGGSIENCSGASVAGLGIRD